MDSDSDDEVPLGKLLLLQRQISLKRDRAAAGLHLETVESATPAVLDDNVTSAGAASTSQSRPCREEEGPALLETITSSSNESDLDDSDRDPDFSLPKRKTKRANTTHSSTENNVVTICTSSPEDVVPQTPSAEARGRTKLRKSKTERDLEKKRRKEEKVREKYYVKPGCGDKCKRKAKCQDSIPLDIQQAINKNYWSLDFGQQRIFVANLIAKCETVRRTVKSPKKMKSASYKCSLKAQDGNIITVCQSFFLGTLGSMNAMTV
ncbi:hypothetical protein ElyMa_004406500 [Elysia marginata]|uniref:PiggyBac transposable element-derived protein domain-containing protein n=1 Tax=Elysia marginata TaxID=1093978 RepID=A0AAV4HAS4_9GAST|nr:hypothetical protein ElyMa_004406500 [Elysia marginata]